jgi:hypothetical protein
LFQVGLRPKALRCAGYGVVVKVAAPLGRCCHARTAGLGDCRGRPYCPGYTVVTSPGSESTSGGETDLCRVTMTLGSREGVPCQRQWILFIKLHERVLGHVLQPLHLGVLSHPIYKNINRAIIYVPGSSHAYIQQNHQDSTTRISK